jgi:hypothetical protein
LGHLVSHTPYLGKPGFGSIDNVTNNAPDSRTAYQQNNKNDIPEDGRSYHPGINDYRSVLLCRSENNGAGL